MNPLMHKKDSYKADDEIACRYCGKPLAMWVGSPDLSACDVICFECFRESYDKENNNKEVFDEQTKKLNRLTS